MNHLTIRTKAHPISFKYVNKILPILKYANSKDTIATLHLFTQIIGKIKLALLPWINHSWHVSLFVTPAGLTTGDMSHKSINFQIDLDLVEHVLKISTDEGKENKFSLLYISVSDFYDKIFKGL